MITQYLNQLPHSNQPSTQQQEQHEKLFDPSEQESVLEAIKSSQVKQQDKQIMLDDLECEALIAAADEESPKSKGSAELVGAKTRLQKRNPVGAQVYRSNSGKLTTLVECATMEDMSEVESPVKKPKKSRHKKA